MGANLSPSQRPLALCETPETPSRSFPVPMVDLELCGTSQPLLEMEIPMGDSTSPASREDGNSSIYLSPVRRCLSPVAHSHVRKSHAKLRSLPGPAIELDSDGVEMSPTSSQGMSMSFSASSGLDLLGTLPSEVGDFFDMVDAYTSQS